MVWKGDSLKSIVEYKSEFQAAKTSRYKEFPDNPASITEPGDRAFAVACYAIADDILNAASPNVPGRTGSYPYVWFQKGNTSPNEDRATDDPKHLGSHWFWSFAEGGEKP